MAPEPVAIRHAEPADAQAVLRLLRETVEAIPDAWYTTLQRESWKALFTEDALAGLLQRQAQPQGQAHALVVEDASRMMAFACLAGDEVKMLYVHPSAQGTGLGGQLLTQLETEARRRGVSRLRLRASANALGFYKGRGYARDPGNASSATGSTSCDCGGQVLCTWLAKTL